MGYPGQRLHVLGERSSVSINARSWAKQPGLSLDGML